MALSREQIQKWSGYRNESSSLLIEEEPISNPRTCMFFFPNDFKHYSYFFQFFLELYFQNFFRKRDVALLLIYVLLRMAYAAPSHHVSKQTRGICRTTCPTDTTHTHSLPLISQILSHPIYQRDKKRRNNAFVI